GRLGARRGHHPDGPRRAGPRRAVAARPEPAGARLRAQRPLRLLLGREPAGGHRGLGAAAMGHGLPGGLRGRRLHRRVPGVAGSGSGAGGLDVAGVSGPSLGSASSPGTGSSVCSGGDVSAVLGSSDGPVGPSVGGSVGSSPVSSVCGGSDVSGVCGAVGVLCPPLPDGVRPPLPCPEDVPAVLPVRRGASEEPRSRPVVDPTGSAGADGSAVVVGSLGDGVALGSGSVGSGSVGSGSVGSGS